MDRFRPGERVIVPDLGDNGREVVAQVDGTWGIEGVEGPTHYRVWVIMPDRTVRVYEKHEVRHVTESKDRLPPAPQK